MIKNYEQSNIKSSVDSDKQVYGPRGVIPTITREGDLMTAEILANRLNLRGLNYDSVKGVKVKSLTLTGELIINQNFPNTAGYYKPLRLYNTALQTGETVQLAIGRSNDTNNQGEINFNFVGGAGASTNTISVGIYGTPGILTLALNRATIAGFLNLYNGANSAIIDSSSINTSDKTFTLPNETGTFALRGINYFTGQQTIAGTIITGSGTDDAAIELGSNGSGNRNAYIDFHTDDTNTDYGLRIIKYAGVNGASEITALGTGGFAIGATGSITIKSAVNYAADNEASDTYVITLAPAITAYTTGMHVTFKANTANTGAASININGLGAKTIVKAVSTALSNNDILAGMFCLLIYNGTNFVLMNPRTL